MILALQVNSGTDAVAGVNYQSSSLVIELQADRLRNEPLVWLGSARVVRERRASGRFFRFSLKFLPSRSSTVHTLMVLCPGAEKKRNDMDSAKRCRDQSAECLHLMKLAQSQTEARVLKDIAHSWVRLANQIDRYTALAKSNGPHRAKGMPRRRTGVAPRSGI